MYDFSASENCELNPSHGKFSQEHGDKLKPMCFFGDIPHFQAKQFSRIVNCLLGTLPNAR